MMNTETMMKEVMKHIDEITNRISEMDCTLLLIMAGIP